MQQAQIQAEPHGVHGRENLEGERGEHRSQDHAGRGPDEHPQSDLPAAQEAPLAVDDAARSVSRRRPSKPVRLRVGAKPAVVGTATVTTPVLPGKLTGTRLPGLARRGGVPRPRPDPPRRWRDGGPGRSHEHLQHGDHDLEIRNAPRRPDLQRGRDAAGRAEIAAGGQRQPVHEHADRADDDRRSERRQIRQKTKISVRNCPVAITGHKTSGITALVKVKTPAAGRISGSGTDLQFVTRNLSKASHCHDQRAAHADRRGNTAEIRAAAAQAARRLRPEDRAHQLQGVRDRHFPLLAGALERSAPLAF